MSADNFKDVEFLIVFFLLSTLVITIILFIIAKTYVTLKGATKGIAKEHIETIKKNKEIKYVEKQLNSLKPEEVDVLIGLAKGSVSANDVVNKMNQAIAIANQNKNV